MAYTSKQTARETQTIEEATAKQTAPAFTDQRTSTGVQLQQQQLMNTAQAKFVPAQRAGAEEEEALQGKFETAQRAEEEELLQGKFETAQCAEEEELLQGKFETAQRAEEEELLQGKFESAQLAGVEEEELLQGKFSIDPNSQATAQREEKPNNTGLPNQLKTGIESLSGMSLDGVRVHYNSSEPAQLNAHAYAQGTDIHVAPGQEQHLPHEAWHVVQQAQGRVKPTTQMNGTSVNDDVSLETEADVMGAKAAQLKNIPYKDFINSTQSKTNDVIQNYSVVQLHDSVPANKVKSAINTLHSDWTIGSDERTMTVWQIADDANWDFHFTAMYDKTGGNMTKFHFTIRHKTGSKGDDAFAWFNVVGHNKAATLGARENAGKATYWITSSTDYALITPTTSALFANINTWAANILSTTVSYIK